MSTRVFRIKKPGRTYAETHSKYRDYKPHLAKDFHYNCGYCNAADAFLGGKSVYHVDHFAPKKQFAHLETEYSNLVYSCPYCNRHKSNDWPSSSAEISVVDDIGYIDPCDISYDSHFQRDKDGTIIANTPIGKYMYQRLQFFMPRHRLLWNLSHLKSIIDEMLVEINRLKEEGKEHDKLLSKCEALTLEQFKYMNHLIGVQRE